MSPLRVVVSVPVRVAGRGARDVDLCEENLLQPQVAAARHLEERAEALPLVDVFKVFWIGVGVEPRERRERGGGMCVKFVCGPAPEGAEGGGEGVCGEEEAEGGACRKVRHHETDRARRGYVQIPLMSCSLCRFASAWALFVSRCGEGEPARGSEREWEREEDSRASPRR